MLGLPAAVVLQAPCWRLGALAGADAYATPPLCPHTQDQAPADKEDRAKWVWVKAQKWALHITYRLFTRYVNPPRCEPGNDMTFAKRFAVSQGGGRQQLLAAGRAVWVLAVQRSVCV